VAQCITCGAELHPDRAKKYDYCLAPECQEKNFKGLTMVAVGMNKAADELMILDEETRANLASGKWRDQRRGTYGSAEDVPRGRSAGSSAGASPAATSVAATSVAATSVAAATTPAGRTPAARSSTARSSAGRPPVARAPARRAPAPPPWTRSQEKLALLYNQQGLRPAEIAQKLGVSGHLVTQIILAAKNRGKS
jgi:hypothetical protein